MTKPELLAPAGSLEVLETAVLYGADAVYLGGPMYGLRANAKNFTMDEIKKAVEFAHAHNTRVYITVNIIAHNQDLRYIDKYFKDLESIGVDALIIADPGIFSVAREVVPDMELHVSTQANNTNYRTVEFWLKQGAKRVVVARELSIKEIAEIKRYLQNVDLEAFVHGAMCISYSGRCLLSNYMAGRDSNHGDCAQPCRWRYHIVEETRPGVYMPIHEDERGTYIFNSKDLCMLEYIPELIGAGIHSLKIEGRMKTAYYVATVVKAYREAIDDYFKDPKIYEKKKEYYISEICKSSYRDYTTGFYFEKPSANEQIYDKATYIREYNFCGLILDYDKKSKIATVEQRNKFVVGDEIEILRKKEAFTTQIIEYITDEEGNMIKEAPHPKQILKVKINTPVEKYDMIRKRV
ncbi:MAG: peptidase U32 [Clostridiales bacterium GWE2_32_10]|nr:MAG: peptidase U32 [Clostridiales bacterium GWE2_32_10]HBY19895.1 peptidase U32 [Clostridiales bacterium]